LLRLAGASPADLAKAAGISQPTAGKITTELLQLGVLQEAGSASDSNASGNGSSSRLGRPGQLLRLDGRRARFLAIELGVSETLISALPVAVQLQDKWSRSFATPKSPDAWLDKLKLDAADLLKAELWGVVFVVPGISD